MLSDDSRLILKAATVGRLLTCALLWLLPTLFRLPAFDSSAEVILGPRSHLEGFVRWDTLYFVRIALRGYTREQEHAFQPGLPLAMRYGGRAILGLRGGDELEARDVVVAGIVLANIAAIGAALVFHRLTFAVTRNASFSRLAALLYCLPPSPPTLSVPYTEPFFALFSFTGMLLVERRRTAMAAVAFAAATSSRAQGVLNLGFIVYALVIVPRPLRIISVIKSVVLSAVVAAPFVASQRRGYLQFCLDEQQTRPWCGDRLPMIYSFVQEHYWDNGWLRYWTLLQSPLFVLSAPVLAISIYASARHYRALGWSTVRLSVPFASRHPPPPTTNALESPALLPYVHLHTFSTILLLFFSHVQICLRQAVTDPVIFWAAADLLQRRRGEASGRPWGQWWARYCATWGAMAIVLWATFMPPA